MKKSLLKTIIVVILIISYVYICSIISIPENIVIFEGDNLNLKIATGLSLSSRNQQTVLTASNIGTKKIDKEGIDKLNLNLFGGIKLKSVNVAVIPKTTVIPLGTAIGMKLYTKGVLVVGMSQINTDNNEKTKPYENSGIEEGDMIVKINEKEVTCTAELIESVNDSNGEDLNIKYIRDGIEHTANIEPIKTNENEYKLGLWVRDGAAGIGTITYYEPSTKKYAALGHGIVDIDTSKLINISTGELVTARIASIVKGKEGTPGEIKGSIVNRANYRKC